LFYLRFPFNAKTNFGVILAARFAGRALDRVLARASFLLDRVRKFEKSDPVG
jgi:hypothetical protein